MAKSWKVEAGIWPYSKDAGGSDKVSHYYKDPKDAVKVAQRYASKAEVKEGGKEGSVSVEKYKNERRYNGGYGTADVSPSTRFGKNFAFRG